MCGKICGILTHYLTINTLKSLISSLLLKLLQSHHSHQIFKFVEIKKTTQTRINKGF